jgi:hypothetical protein
MATSNVPARIPERPATTPDSNPRPWRQDKKTSRFVIKLGGVVPS